MDHSCSLESASTPQLSQDILELIIDAITLWSDTYRSARTLRFCCLASRCLVPRSRFHLFHIIKFSNARRWTTFQETPQIGAWVNVLDVYNDPKWVTSELNAVCAHMKYLEEIFFRGVKWGNLDLKGCHALKRIFLVDVDMTGFWEGVVPQVEELTLFGRIKGESVEGFNGNLKLLEIELRPHVKKILQSVLAKPEMLRNLRSLAVKFVEQNEEEWLLFVKLLQRTKDRLEELKVTDLPSCGFESILLHLRMLRIRKLAVWFKARSEDLSQWLTVITKLVVPTVKEIDFFAPSPNTGKIKGIESLWDALDDLNVKLMINLSCDKPRQPSRFSFQDMIYRDPPAGKQELEEPRRFIVGRLSKMSKMGVLDVQVTFTKRLITIYG